MKNSLTFKKIYFAFLYVICVMQKCDTDLVLEPIVEVTEGQLLKAKSTFVLTCTVNVPNETSVLFQWAYPNKNEMGTRILTADVASEKVSNDSVQEKMSILTVKQAQRSDSGIYICLVIDDARNTGFDKIFLPVTGAGISLPPVLNISSEYIDIKSQSTLYISCSGKSSLLWKLPAKKDVEHADLMVSSNVSKEETFYSRISNFMLNDVQFTDTGFYSCYYRGANNFTSIAYSTHLYVFVNDPKHLFAEDSAGNILVLFKRHEDVTIPCLPTDSSINVTLWKKIKDGNYYEFISTSDRITFDHMRGFKLEFRQLDLDSMYQCRASSDKTNEELNIHILKESDTYYDYQKNNHYQPVIDIIGKKDIVIGGKFALKCSFSADPDKKIFVDWNYPNKDAAGFRIREKSNISHFIHVYDKNYIYRITYFLLIEKVKASDSGLYYFLVMDDSQNIGWDKIWISVLPDIPNDPRKYKYYQPRIALPETANLVVNEAFHLKCTVRVNDEDKTSLSLNWSYPNNNETGSCINETKSLISRIKVGDIYVREFVSYLTVYKAHANDSGIYICYINGNSLTYGWDKTWIFIHEEKKTDFKISIATTDAQSPIVNQNYSFTCSIRTHPDILLYIDWSYPNNLENDTRIQESNTIHQWIKMHDYYVYEHSSTLTIEKAYLSDSGTYTCFVTDNAAQQVRMSSVEVTFKVKDVEAEGFYLTTTSIAIIIFILIIILFAMARPSIALRFIRRARFAIPFVRRYLEPMKKRNRKIFIIENLAKRDDNNIFNPDLPLKDQIDLLPYDKRWEFPKSKLKLEKTLGQGVFGKVKEAEATEIVKGESSTTVVVKMLKETAREKHRNALLTELKILMHVGKHLNIVNLLGAVTENIEQGELYMIVEYCSYGNMKRFLQKGKSTFVDQLNSQTGELDCEQYTISDALSIKGNTIVYNNVSRNGIENLLFRDDSTSSENFSSHTRSDSSSISPLALSRYDSNSDFSAASWRFRQNENSASDIEQAKHITTTDLLSFSFQCAKGMEYLSSKMLVHRNLAARNVLIAKDYVVKISDFGLTKDCHKCVIYGNTKGDHVPEKWMAVESIKDGIFTTKSDVWSFGILLWEIFTLGDTPYSEEKFNNRFVKKLEQGYRMKSPDLAPKKINGIMQECWLKDPNQRPDFSLLVESIGSLLESKVLKHYINLNKSYQLMNEELMKERDELELSSGKRYYVNIAFNPNE